jgi:hypothetical protein
MTVASVGKMIGTGAAAIILYLVTTNANATVFRCTEAKEEAVLGTAGSVNSSHGNGKCRWSVDGASIEKNPGEAVAVRNRTRNALNAFIVAATGPSRNLSDVRQISELLLGPFFGANIPSGVMSSLESAFRSDGTRFAGCVSRDGSIVPSDSRLLCQRIAPDRDRISNVWSMEVSPTEPFLVLGVNVDNQRYMLFLPERYIEGRFQFR